MKISKKRAILSVKIIIISLFSCIVSANDWPHWRGPDYTGISGETGIDPSALNTGKDPVWEASVGTGYSSVVVSKGKVYTMGNTGKKGVKESEHMDIVFCFDAENGREIWRHAYQQRLDPKYYTGGTLASPTVDKDRVYTLSKDGILFCLNAANGDVVWEKNVSKNYGAKRPTWGFSGSPLVYNDLLILNMGTYGTALKKNDGSLVWQNGKSEGGYATPVPFKLDGKEYIALFVCKELAAVEPDTGKIAWKHNWQTQYDINAADPIIKDNNVFITSGYGKGCSLMEISADKATQVWSNKNMRSRMSGPVLINGYLYGIDDKRFNCVNFKTGQLAWSTGVSGEGSVSAVGDKLILLSEKGKLIIAEATPEAFKEISSAQILSGQCWTMPVLANGRIYAKNTAGRLVCLDVEK